MSRIYTQSVAVDTSGSAGAATGSASFRACYGFLLDVYVDYHANAPATTDLTIAHVNPIYGNVLVLTDTNTDGRYTPRDTVHTTAGATSDPDGYDRIPLTGGLSVSIAQADELEPCATVTIRWMAA